MEDKIRCECCGCILSEDNNGSETLCITCWEFWIEEYEED